MWTHSLLLGTLALCAVAQPPAAFQFLRTVSSARSAGVAHATTALPSDAGAQLLNPAIGATVAPYTLTSTLLKHVLDINSGSVFLTGIPLGSARAAVGVAYMDYGTFERRDARGNALGSFSAHDLAISFAYSDTLEPRLFYGVAAKLLWEQLESYHAWVLALDAGLLYRFPDERTSIGVSVLHAGTALRRFAHDALPLPTDLRLGLTHFLRGLPAVFNFSFVRLTEPTPSVWQKFENFALGVEIQIGTAAQLRLGYDNALRRAAPAGQRGVTGITGGAGLTLSDIRVDYSLTLVSAAVLHRLGVQVGM